MKAHRKLGISNGRLAPMPTSPNAVSSQTTNKRQYVDPLSLAGSVEETSNRILECLKSMRNNKVASHSEHYIHAVFTSPLMRFKDDVEFYIDESAQQLHFRSASRIGHSDLGANRKRYQAFKALYQSKK